jgi:hypothetical protein
MEGPDTFNLTPEEDVIFREEQRFRQLWLWCILLVTLGGCVAPFVAFLIESGPDRDEAEYKAILISTLVSAGIMLAVAILIYCMNLVTEVRPSGLYVKYFPFHLSFKKIPLEDVAEMKAVTYRPVMEYGGWGIRRRWRGKGKAYNVRGNRGVRIDYHSGRDILIGSQRADEFAQALAGVMGGE